LGCDWLATPVYLHYEAALSDNTTLIKELYRFYKSMLTQEELKVNLKVLNNPEVAEKSFSANEASEAKDQQRKNIKLKTLHTLKILHKLL
jgi:hypothetical protein